MQKVFFSYLPTYPTKKKMGRGTANKQFFKDGLGTGKVETICYPHDGIFSLHLTAIMDSYNLFRSSPLDT